MSYFHVHLRAWIGRSIALAAGLMASDAFADPLQAPESARPLDQAIELRETRCLEHGRFARGLGEMLGRDELDPRLAIDVGPDGEGSIVFTIRRDGQGVAERRLEVRGMPCARVEALVILSVGLALESTLLVAPTPASSHENAAEPIASRTDGALPREPSVATETAWVSGAPTGPSSPENVVRPKVMDSGTASFPAHEGPHSPAHRGARTGLGVAIEQRIVLGVMPEPILGFSAAGSLALPNRLRLRGGLLATVPVDVDVDGGGANVGVVAVELAACLTFLRGLWGAVDGCVGPTAGTWRARGYGFHENDASTVAWLAGMAGAEARVHVTSWLDVRTSLFAVVPVVRPSFTVTPSTGEQVNVLDAATVGASVGLGPEVHF